MSILHGVAMSPGTAVIDWEAFSASPPALDSVGWVQEPAEREEMPSRREN